MKTTDQSGFRRLFELCGYIYSAAVLTGAIILALQFHFGGLQPNSSQLRSSDQSQQMLQKESELREPSSAPARSELEVLQPSHYKGSDTRGSKPAARPPMVSSSGS